MAVPRWFSTLSKRYGRIIKAQEALAAAIREEGPIDEKTQHLIQLAAAACLRSEGAVHSHTRRAIEAGASPDEIRHAVLLMINTAGFPLASAAMCWVEDTLKTGRKGKK